MPWISAGASLLGGLFGSDSASDAASAQAAGTAAATAEQKRQFDLTRSDYAPYRNIGSNALRRLGALYGVGDGGGSTSGGMSEEQIRQMLSPQYTTGGTQAAWTPTGPEGGGYWTDGTPSTVNQSGLDEAVRQRMGQGTQGAPQTYNDEFSQPIQMDPGYQFGLTQGQQALDRKASAAGGRLSGASLKAATQFGNNYATTQYGAAYQRRQDSINRLASLAGIGQSATGASAQAGQNAANNTSALLQNQGDNAGNAALAQGNIWGNALNQGAAAYQRGQQNQSFWPSDRGQSWSYDK